MKDELPCDTCRYYKRSEFVEPCLSCNNGRGTKKNYVPITKHKIKVPIHQFEEGQPSALDTQTGGDHYKKLVIQPMEYIVKNGLDFCQGSVIKYVTRWRNKGGIEDLKKAIHVLEIYMELEKKKIENTQPLPERELTMTNPPKFKPIL